MIVWTADLPSDSPDGSIAIAFFNTGESQVVLDSSFEAYNWKPPPTASKTSGLEKPSTRSSPSKVSPSNRTPAFSGS